MKKRTKKQNEDLLTQMEAPPAPEPPPVETAALAFLEYKPFSTTDKWRVELFELFQAEFQLTPPFDKAMTMFHEVAEGYARGWLMAKLLFGIMPMFVPGGMDPKDMQVLSREAICAKLGIEKPQLQAELDALRTLWQSSLAVRVEEPATPEAPSGELPLDENVFHSLGFSEAIFEVCRVDRETNVEKPRTDEEKNTERTWFIKRVLDWGKMLSEPMASTLVRQTLMNELYLRRLETEICMKMPGTKAFEGLEKIKNGMESTYEKQLEQLKTMFPEMNIAGKSTLHGAYSDLKDAYIEYKNHKSTRLIDKLRTSAEIDVEFRQSVQKPDPQYRFGLNIYCIEAMHGLYDPDWVSKIPMRVLKKMDAAGRAAIEAGRVEAGEAMVDLELGVAPGEGSQFPDLEEVK